MIRHILSTGEVVDDISGHTVKDAVVDDLLRKMEEKHGKEEQNEE